MRKLEQEFINKFEKEFKFVIEFVKKNKEDVFFGIRDNSINLYVNGGSFLQISLIGGKYIARINAGDPMNKKGYSNEIDRVTSNILSKINNKEINNDNVDMWQEILPNLKGAVKRYMVRHKVGRGYGSSKEKILQQKLALSFNNENTPYFTCDMEYNIKSLNDYYHLKNGDIDSVRTPHTFGRMDNILIRIKDNKLKLYLFEIKEGTAAIKSTNYNSNSKQKKYDSFGNGIIGHINLYMTIIDHIKKDIPYHSKYRVNKNLIQSTINIKEQIFEEIKSTMLFYQKYDLINNENYKHIDYKKLIFDDVELVFYLSGYKENSKIFEKHLGIIGKMKDSVINLINNNPTMYEYISADQLYDFKYYKDYKVFRENRCNEDLDIESYNTIKVIKDKNNKVSLEAVIEN